MKEEDDKDVENGEDPGQKEVDRSAAEEVAEVQEVILKNAEGENNSGDEAEISQRIERNTTDRENGESEQEPRETDPPENVLDPVFPVIIQSPSHVAVEDRKTVDDRKDDRHRKEMKEGSCTGNPSEGVVMEAVDVQIGGNDGEKSDAEEPGHDLQPSSATDV